MELHAVVPQNRWKRLTFRMVVCTFLLLIPIIDAPSPNPTSVLMFNNPFMGIDFVLHAACLLFGYINFYFLIPRFFYQQSRTLYFFWVIVSLAVICTLPSILAELPFVPYFPDKHELQIHTIIQIRHVFFLFVVTLLFGILTHAEMRRRQAEREKLIAEMRYMKSRINPHFLFNTLNSIYGLIQVNPEKAGESLLKMSNIMRYILSSSEKMYMPLTLSLQYIDEYISLQRERFLDTIIVDYRADVSRNDLQISPLLLLPFIENAFKYGISPEACSVIEVFISNEGKELHLHVSNIDYSHWKDKRNSTGIGIENTKNRLDLLYKNRHRIEIKKENGKFVVDLFITLAKL